MKPLKNLLKKSYSFYLFVQLRCVISPSELEYDRQFDIDQQLYHSYKNSSFNDDAKPEYECIQNFLHQYKNNTKYFLYFLFGENACDLYEEGVTIREIKDTHSFGVIAYNPAITSPQVLLAAFEGWTGYTEITEEQYNQLKS